MRNLFVSFFVLSSLFSSSQVKKPAAVPVYTVKTDVEKMARDYYAHFYYTKGDKLSENESAVIYSCKVVPKDAVQSTIIQYKSEVNDYSWQADMISTEEYSKAVSKYKTLYNQINGASFSMHDGKTYKIKGQYDAPDESRRFASSILEMDVKERDLKRLKIEVSLEYNMPNWIVKILIYEKEEDEEIRPSERTN